MLGRILDKIFLVRPFLLIPMWAFFGLGSHLGGIDAGEIGGVWMLSLPAPFGEIAILYGLPTRFFIYLVCFSLVTAGTYVLNQIGDIEVDRKNPGFRLLASGTVSLRAAKCIAFWLFVLPLAVILFFDWFAFGICLAGCLLGFAYSLPPFRFSGRPILDFLSNATGYGFLAFGMGWVSMGSADYAAMLGSALPYFLLMSAGSIASTIPDMEGDRAEGKNTTSVTLGIRVASGIAFIAIVGAGACAVLSGDAIALFSAVFSVFFFGRLVVRPEKRYAFPAYQVAGSLLVVASLLVRLPLLAFSFLVLLSTRTYFRMRHGVVYPKMGR